MNKFINLKIIIINLFKTKQKSYLSFKELQEFLSFLYSELSSQHKLGDYNIIFNINLYTMEQIVQYDKEIFGIDTKNEIIYLRNPEIINLLMENYQLDKTILDIITNFFIKKH